MSIVTAITNYSKCLILHSLLTFFLIINLLLITTTTNNNKHFVNGQQECYGFTNLQTCLSSFGQCIDVNSCVFPVLPDYYYISGNNVKGNLAINTNREMNNNGVIYPATVNYVDNIVPSNLTRNLIGNDNYINRLLWIHTRTFSNLTYLSDFNGYLYVIGDVSNQGDLFSSENLNISVITVIGDNNAKGFITLDNQLYLSGSNFYNNLGINDFTKKQLNNLQFYNITLMESNNNNIIDNFNNDNNNSTIILNAFLNQYSSVKTIYNFDTNKYALMTSGLINFILKNINIPENINNLINLNDETTLNLLTSKVLNESILYNNLNELDISNVQITKLNLFLLKRIGNLLVFGKNSTFFEVKLPNGELIEDFKCISISDGENVLFNNYLQNNAFDSMCIIKSNTNQLYFFGDVTNHPCLLNPANQLSLQPITIDKDWVKNTLLYKIYTPSGGNSINQIEITKNNLFMLLNDGFVYACGTNVNNVLGFQSLVLGNTVSTTLVTTNNLVATKTGTENYRHVSNDGKVYASLKSTFYRVMIPYQNRKIWMFSVNANGDGLLMVPSYLCNTEYYGAENCEISFQCNGKNPNDMNACSGNGECLAPETCKCKPGYSGKYCADYYCNGLLASNSSVCSTPRNGFCKTPEVCECNSGYFGKNCQYSHQFYTYNLNQNISYSTFTQELDFEFNSKVSIINTTSNNGYDILVSGKVFDADIAPPHTIYIAKSHVDIINNSPSITASSKIFEGRNGWDGIFLHASFKLAGPKIYDYVVLGDYIYATGHMFVELQQSITICGTVLNGPASGTSYFLVVFKILAKDGTCLWLGSYGQLFPSVVLTPNSITAHSTSTGSDILYVTAKTQTIGKVDGYLISIDGGSGTELRGYSFSSSGNDVSLTNAYISSNMRYLYLIGSFSGSNLFSTNNPETNFIVRDGKGNTNEKIVFLLSGKLYEMESLGTSLTLDLPIEGAFTFPFYGDFSGLTITEKEDEIYFSGRITGFDASSTYQTTINGVHDAFIVRYDENLNIVWMRTFGPASTSEKLAGATINSTTLTTEGYLFATGVYFGNSFTIDNFTFPHYGPMSNSTIFKASFIMKLDSRNGKVVWATSAFSENIDVGGFADGTNIALDPYGNIVWGITFSKQLTLQNGKKMDCPSGNPKSCSIVTTYTIGCVPGNYGPNCENFDCFGISKLSNNTCSGHGQCLSTNLCQCQIGNYTGNNCQFPICNLISANDTSLVCNGHGNCIGPENCNCSDLYHGKYCELPKCFGLKSTNQSVCSGRGSCLDVNYCNCTQGYSGEQCQHSICFGIESNNTDVCSGHGICDTHNHCTCFPGYGGSNCELPKCFDILSNETTTVCGGRGSCIAPNVCNCTNYGGPQCEYPKCFDVLSNETSVVCNGHGSCISPNNCLCIPGNYTGPSCQYPICNSIPANETATVCNGHGSCVAPDICDCGNTYGKYCESPKCFGIRSDNENVCNGRGDCIGINTCSCQPGNFTGQQCEFSICFGLPSNDTNNVCSGNGACFDVNKCSCKDSTFKGERCQFPSCYGKNKFNGDIVCSGNGECLDLDFCKCNDGHFGNQCQYISCFGNAHTVNRKGKVLPSAADVLCQKIQNQMKR